MSVGIVWLQDDSRVSGQVGAFINVRASAGVWNRTLLYDYVANPPSGVDPSATALTNLTAAPTSNASFTDIGTIFGVTGLLSVPHQNYPVAFAELGGTPATELDGTNNSCVDFSYTSGAVPQGAWLIAGVWWSVMQLPAAFQGDGLDHIRVYKSTDFVTWTGVDTANEIVQKAAAWYFDGTNVIYFCYKDANTNQTTQIEFTISGSSGSWGAPHGAALLSTFVYSLVYSPVGPTWHGLFLDVSNQPVYGYSDGTTWTFPSITLLQGNWTSKASYILLDPNNTTVHIVCGDYYNQVTTGGVLALTTHLSAIVPGASMTFGGRGVINGGSLFFPTTSNSTGELYCLVSSGPLSAPTFAAELVDDAFHSDEGVAEESIALVVSAPAPTPTLQLGKTVVGGTAIPSDFIVTATGPDTLAGAGGVGPANVTAGTYNLSETGPAQYVGVWNCNATMPTSTSVVVPDSSTAVVCTLTNTFTPTPPPPPTPADAVLRYQIPQRRWFPHNYHDHLIEHYLDEANVDQPNDMQLLMLAGTHILKSGGNTDNGTDITTLVYLPSNDGGDQRAQKLYVDTMLEADQTGQVISQVRFNNQQQLGPSVAMNPTGLREQFLENISSLADLRLYRNIMAVLSWTGGPDGPRIYAFEPSGFAQPYVSTFFVTQYINLAYPGWKHARRLYPAYISNSPILLTIETQDNRVYGPYTLPSTSGQFRIIPMILNHGVKDLAFAFQLDGQGSPFALFPGEFVVEVKGWADPDYIDLAVFHT